MREPLPDPRHGAYDRHTPWVCGHAAEGTPCTFGPSHRGACPAMVECSPVEINGLWQCGRSEPRGGPCENGPTSDGRCCQHRECRPTRSLRSKRGIVVRSVALFAIGLVLMCLGSSYRNRALVPGELTSHHAQVLRGAGWENRCSTCHATGNSTPDVILTSAVTGQQVGPTQTALCIRCHEKTIPDALATSPHNLSPTALVNLTSAVGTEHGAEGVDKNLACSVCHQEHHGADHKIAAIDNKRCQACHQRQFDNFATSHPDLGTWPYTRRTPISFSHTTHSGKHFATKGKEFACATCHFEDSTHNVQLTATYEKACAECHDNSIRISVASGVDLLTLPMLDVDTLKEEGLEIGHWPEGATGDFDGALSPALRMLLARDAKAAAAMKLLGPDFEFIDIAPDDSDHLRAAADLAAAIKKLVLQLPTAGNKAGQLATGLDSSLAQQAIQNWFPASEQETSDGLPDVGQGSVLRATGRWSVDATTLAIQYQPSGHADSVLKNWIDQAVALDESPLRKAILAEIASPTSPGQCASCHSIERTPSGGLTVNWTPADRTREPRPFTRFSHRPHLMQVELRDCKACHQVNATADTSLSYATHDPRSFVSDFHPVSKATCASCHTQTSVGESCTQCHNYHVGELPMNVLELTRQPSEDLLRR